MNEEENKGVTVPGWLLGAAAIAGAWYFLRRKNKQLGPGVPGNSVQRGVPAIPGMPAPEGGPTTGAGPAQVVQQDFSGQVSGGAVISDPFAPPQQVAQATQAPRMAGNTDSNNWKYQGGQAPQRAGMYEDLSGLM